MAIELSGKTEIDQMKAELRELEAGRGRRKQEIDQKESEQRGHMVAARVRKDVAAQRNIDRLEDEISLLQNANLQDLGAAEELRARIEAEEAELEREILLSRYGSVQLLLKQRVEGKLVRRLLDLATEMKKTAAEIDASDEKIIKALMGFGAEFSNERDEFRYRTAGRRNLIACILSDVLGTSGWSAIDPSDMPAIGN